MGMMTLLTVTTMFDSVRILSGKKLKFYLFLYRFGITFHEFHIFPSSISGCSSAYSLSSTASSSSSSWPFFLDLVGKKGLKRYQDVNHPKPSIYFLLSVWAPEQDLSSADVRGDERRVLALHPGGVWELYWGWRVIEILLVSVIPWYNIVVKWMLCATIYDSKYILQTIIHSKSKSLGRKIWYVIGRLEQSICGGKFKSIGDQYLAQGGQWHKE